jgi:hypothetical protein
LRMIQSVLRALRRIAGRLRSSRVMASATLSLYSLSLPLGGTNCPRSDISEHIARKRTLGFTGVFEVCARVQFPTAQPFNSEEFGLIFDNRLLRAKRTRFGQARARRKARSNLCNKTMMRCEHLKSGGGNRVRNSELSSKINALECGAAWAIRTHGPRIGNHTKSLADFRGASGLCRE